MAKYRHICWILSRRSSQTLLEGDDWEGGQEFLMFRGAWFDDKHGGVLLFIDLLHNVSVQPTLTDEHIRKSFYDVDSMPYRICVMASSRK